MTVYHAIFFLVWTGAVAFVTYTLVKRGADKKLKEAYKRIENLLGAGNGK